MSMFYRHQICSRQRRCRELATFQNLPPPRRALSASLPAPWRGWSRGYRAATDLHRWLADKPKVTRRVERWEYENVN